MWAGQQGDGGFKNLIVTGAESAVDVIDHQGCRKLGVEGVIRHRQQDQIGLDRKFAAGHFLPGEEPGWNERALYAAAQAGVRIDLIVRGVCCLRPGVPGVSENIRVVSVIGRFLEHSRIYYFHNGGRFQVYCGSADLMRRNLDRRVEVLFPVEDRVLKKHMRDEMLEIYLRDTVNAHELQPDGSYLRLRPAKGQAPFSAQDWFLAHSGAHGEGE